VQARRWYRENGSTQDLHALIAAQKMPHPALSGIGFDPAGRSRLGVAEGTARHGPGGPDVAPGAVSRRTTVAGRPPRVLTPVPAAALRASNADFTMDFIEAACRISKDSIAAGERLKLRGSGSVS
jgi:hypothetical protein